MYKETNFSFNTQILFDGFKYFDDRVKPYLSHPISILYLELVRQFLRIDTLNLDSKNIIVKIPYRSENHIIEASKIVNYGYSSMYLNSTDNVAEIAKTNDDKLNMNFTTVVLDRFEGEEVVVGTHTMVFGDCLEVFRLFETKKGCKWPHQETLDQAGEFTRLSFHPFIEALIYSLPLNQRQPVYDYRKEIWEKLWIFSIGAMKGLGIKTPYLILAPHVLKFLQRNGLDPIEVENVEFSHNAYAIEIRSKFKEYWKPGSDKSFQPKVYIAPGSLKHER